MGSSCFNIALTKYHSWPVCMVWMLSACIWPEWALHAGDDCCKIHFVQKSLTFVDQIELVLVCYLLVWAGVEGVPKNLAAGNWQSLKQVPQRFGPTVWGPKPCRFWAKGGFPFHLENPCSTMICWSVCLDFNFKFSCLLRVENPVRSATFSFCTRFKAGHQLWATRQPVSHSLIQSVHQAWAQHILRTEKAQQNLFSNKKKRCLKKALSKNEWSTAQSKR